MIYHINDNLLSYFINIKYIKKDLQCIFKIILKIQILILALII